MLRTDLVERSVVLADVVVLQPLDGLRVPHSLERLPENNSGFTLEQAAELRFSSSGDLVKKGYITLAQVNSLGRLESGVQLVDKGPQRRLEDAVDDVAHEVLEAVEELVEVDKRTLRLQVRVLGDVAPGSGLKKGSSSTLGAGRLCLKGRIPNYKLWVRDFNWLVLIHERPHRYKQLH